ncbi:hypothetical protein N7537_008990 [Penicillium hordei]|uniref:FAD-binding FR-type domain-containing protein n=1 Tax=Penicillium hordei TaxID=40994 RepID=A0AAD6DS95_9EURO|nr:uncharacterized protein N7537_008990 [Penicillium hordei]KAJ5592086.1 hypothetical protein N7537_008990 [Penicillium hordei]
MLLRWLVIALAHGVWANSEDELCVTAVYTAYNYISFVGVPATGKRRWESQCQNPLKVASIYAASEIYCNERERAVGLTQLAEQCQEFGNLELLSREAVAENLTEDAIKNMKRVDYQELPRGEPADAPVLLSASYFGLMFNTLKSWEFETWSHHAFGYVGYAYWGGILSLGMVYRLSDWLFHRQQRRAECALESNVYPLIKLLENIPLVGTGLHWIQTHLMIPAPLATTHGRHLLGFTFSTRVEALVVVGFWMISIVLSVVGYHTFPGNIYWPDVPSQILRYSADRTGIMSFANLPLLWLFGGRNNIFLWATGWSFASFNIFHRHVARVATVQAIVHSILYVVMFIQTGKAWRGMSKTYVLWGILGTFVMILLLITSLDRIRIATYELFLIAHVVLSVLTLVACFYHTVVFEGNEYWKYLWPSVAIWLIDRFLRIVRLCYCNLHVNISNRRLVKVSASRMVYDETADVVRLEVTPGIPSLQPSPGQYYFLYQPFRVTGWESHPFTIGAWSYEIGDPMSLVSTSEGKPINSLDVSHVPLLAGGASERDYQGNSESGTPSEGELKLKLTFWVRPYDGWTKLLRQQCLSSPDKTSETTILLEGPYGETFPLWRYESVLIIVGGTGIASAVPYIQDHLRRSVEDWDGRLENEKTRVRDMELVWTTKQAAFIQDVSRQELKHALKREDFNASFYATRDSTPSAEEPTDLGVDIQLGRPHLQSLIMSRACDACSAGTTLAILVCGPSRMADEARAATHLAMRQGYRSIKFVEESFTW